MHGNVGNHIQECIQFFLFVLTFIISFSFELTKVGFTVRLNTYVLMYKLYKTSQDHQERKMLMLLSLAN